MKTDKPSGTQSSSNISKNHYVWKVAEDVDGAAQQSILPQDSSEKEKQGAAGVNLDSIGM